MENSSDFKNDFKKAIERFLETAGPGCKSAERVAILRAYESQKPAGERICYDPYAIHFVSPGILEWAACNPDKAMALQEMSDRLFPGLDNFVITRVRYFDDFVTRSIDAGLEQLIILGAGYDSRAYRIEELKKITTFEVDHPVTQAVKIEKVKSIFGSLQDHVVFVPVNLGAEDLGRRLLERGYKPSKKSLFLMEGLSYFLPPHVVDEILLFIAKNSGKGSSLILDYYPKSVIDGSYELDIVKNIHSLLAQLGEPLQFGIEDGTVEAFLAQRGFSQIQNATSEDFKKAYFHGVNKDRAVINLLSIVHAAI
ncbi:Leucine carboxyl methyltransferase [uncultured archaeon]|jgi:methyltransferase (TIGR00027 family)|nr:Leucine carboxyl methyltransferase [uncultured archaeon]